jgi:hypothetical protein
LAVSVAIAWAVLARGKVVLWFLYAASALAMVLGIVGILRTEHSHRRRGTITAFLAILIAGFAMIVGPAFVPFMEWPPARTTIAPADGQKYVEGELQRLRASKVRVRFLQGEVRRDSEITSYCLFEVDPGSIATLKQDLISGARSMGWAVEDRGDEAARRMPYPGQPDWFHPGSDADYLQVGSSYWFVFCPSDGRVFFWTSTD